ncbi:chorismate mutase [Candidatus Peregrinibacteria bacterium]|nr:chorismate mutase [Candidatus Peregrinibacteria bacterium]
MQYMRITDIKSLRKKIDQIDTRLIDLLKKRQICTNKIGLIKKKLKFKVKNPERESSKLDSISKTASKKGLNSNFIKRIFKKILKMSRRDQKRL